MRRQQLHSRSSTSQQAGGTPANAHVRLCDRLCRCMARAWEMGSRMLITTWGRQAGGRAGEQHVLLEACC